MRGKRVGTADGSAPARAPAPAAAQRALFAESWAGLHALACLAGRDPVAPAIGVLCVQFSLTGTFAGGRARLEVMVSLAARAFLELTGEAPEVPEDLDLTMAALAEMGVATLLAAVWGACHEATRELTPFALAEPDRSPALLRPLVDELRALGRTCCRASMWYHRRDKA